MKFLIPESLGLKLCSENVTCQIPALLLLYTVKKSVVKLKDVDSIQRSNNAHKGTSNSSRA